MIIFFIFLFIVLFATNLQAQKTSSGDTQAGWGISIANNTLKVDSATVMTVSRASDSIASLKTSLLAKIALTALSLTTTGTSGASSYNNASGAFNIPQYNITDSVQYYNGSGHIIQKIKEWTAIVTPTTGNGYSIDISAAGFSTILSANVTTQFNTGTATSLHVVEIKSISTTAIVVNILQQNVTSILGIDVLAASSFIGSGTGLTAHIIVRGY